LRITFLALWCHLKNGICGVRLLMIYNIYWKKRELELCDTQNARLFETEGVYPSSNLEWSSLTAHFWLKIAKNPPSRKNMSKFCQKKIRQDSVKKRIRQDSVKKKIRQYSVKYIRWDSLRKNDSFSKKYLKILSEENPPKFCQKKILQYSSPSTFYEKVIIIIIIIILLADKD